MLRTRAKKTSRLVRLQASSSSSLFSPLLSAPWFFPNNLISNVYRITSRQSYHQKNAFPIAAFSLNYHSNSRKPHCRYWMPLLPQHTSGFPLKKISKKKNPYVPSWPPVVGFPYKSSPSSLCLIQGRCHSLQPPPWASCWCSPHVLCMELHGRCPPMQVASSTMNRYVAHREPFTYKESNL